jgi:tetratricopeptide (TPR) repeat protein
MKEIRLKLSDVFKVDPAAAEIQADIGNVTAYVLKHYSFLPLPIAVTVDGDEVVITYPEEAEAKKQEAARLVARAVKRATAGEYEKAVGIYKRVLELQPSSHAARRDLAMAYVELGDVDNATNHLIEVLRLDPRDAWAWVVLANLYIREKNDPETGEKFLRRALEITPNDAWALNSLATLHEKRGDTNKALECFDRAIMAQPEFANPYYGKALFLAQQGNSKKALDSLDELFTRAKMQDARSRPVYDGARQLFAQLQRDLATGEQSEAFKAVQNYKAEIETLSGFPIKFEETEFEDMRGATVQMAWKHARDHHLIRTRKGFDEDLLVHLETHELTHLKLESEARKSGRNRFFATTAKSREHAIRSIGADVQKLEKEGFSEDSITKVTLTMVSGLTEFLFNCPLDMIIESYIRETFSVLRPAQFLSLQKMAIEAATTNANADIRRVTPRKIMRGSLALNGAYSLFLDELFHGATAFAEFYARSETFLISRRLFDRWKERAPHLQPGDEYDLVDEFADITGLREWYEWKADPGDHHVAPSVQREGTTNPDLLRQKHPAAVFYFLDAFKRFDQMSPDQIRDVAFEIALVGRSGLDYSDPTEKYHLKNIPGKGFSGLHLMCLMFAGFKRIAPEHDVGMDLEEPFLTALQLHNKPGDQDADLPQ